MSRHTLRLGPSWLVWDTGWVVWEHDPHSVCWGVHWSLYETAAHDTGVVLLVGPVPTLRLRVTVVVGRQQA